MEKFLLDNGFSKPVAEKLEEQGMELQQLFDLDDEKLGEACEEAGFTMKEFKKLKGLLQDKENLLPKERVSEGGDYPKEVQCLVRPQPFTETLKFDNQVLGRIFGFAWGEICVLQFKNYVSECRVTWGELREKIESIGKKVESLRKSGPYAKSVERFMKENVRLEAVDELKLSNAITYISTNSNNIDLLIREISERRKGLFDKDLVVKFWRTAEKEYFEECISKLEAFKDEITNILARCSNLLEDVKRRFRRSTIEEAAIKHKKRRSTQNATKAVYRKKSRQGCVMQTVMQIICPDMGENINVNSISVSSIDSDTLKNLEPHKHIGGLESLIRKEVFEGKAHREVKERLKELQTAAKENSGKYKARKLREAANEGKKDQSNKITSLYASSSSSAGRPPVSPVSPSTPASATLSSAAKSDATPSTPTSATLSSAAKSDATPSTPTSATLSSDAKSDATPSTPTSASLLSAAKSDATPSTPTPTTSLLAFDSAATPSSPTPVTSSSALGSPAAPSTPVSVPSLSALVSPAASLSSVGSISEKSSPAAIPPNTPSAVATPKAWRKNTIGAMFEQQARSRKSLPKPQLEHYITKDLNPISNPMYNNLKVDTESMQFFPVNVDFEVLELLMVPTPLKVKESGNCLFASVSILLCGNEDLSASLRSAASKELLRNAEYYASHSALDVDCGKPHDRVFPLAFSMKTQHEEWEKNRNKLGCVLYEGKRMAEDRVHGSLVVILALAELLKRPIYSVYPDVPVFFRPLLNQKIVPSCCINTTPIFLLWTSKRLEDNSNGFNPNHFVPVVDTSSAPAYIISDLSEEPMVN